LEVHLAKSRRISNLAGTSIPHVITTSHMTHGPLVSYLERCKNCGYAGPLYISQGKSIGLRVIPTISDLRFAYEEMQQQKLDEQAQKVRTSAQNALLGWAKSCGEASDYRDNLPGQCLHPVGHYFEVPNLILNGTLKKMLEDRPQLQYLMLHNIDTVGADVDAGLLGMFADSKATLTFEVIPREIEDVGGGLARVNGRPQIMEGLALPREEDEFKCTYYNSMTTWIHIDRLLETFGLTRDVLGDHERTSAALRRFAERLPTYVALKDVKKRWGEGHEDVFPTAQFEKLWSDMSTLDDVDCKFVVVPRYRGAQLKEQAQLDGWLRDGSSSYLESICEF
jgi:UTP--glucose-1-phosphate uridylyltransferase